MPFAELGPLRMFYTDEGAGDEGAGGDNVQRGRRITDPAAPATAKPP